MEGAVALELIFSNTDILMITKLLLLRYSGHLGVISSTICNLQLMSVLCSLRYNCLMQSFHTD